MPNFDANYECKTILKYQPKFFLLFHDISIASCDKRYFLQLYINFKFSSYSNLNALMTSLSKHVGFTGFNHILIACGRIEKRYASSWRIYLIDIYLNVMLRHKRSCILEVFVKQNCYLAWMKVTVACKGSILYNKNVFSQSWWQRTQIHFLFTKQRLMPLRWWILLLFCSCEIETAFFTVQVHQIC